MSERLSDERVQDLAKECCKAGCCQVAEWVMEGDGETFEFCDRHAQEAQIEHGYECVGTIGESR